MTHAIHAAFPFVCLDNNHKTNVLIVPSHSYDINYCRLYE